MSEALHLNFAALWLALQSTHVLFGGKSFKIQIGTGRKQSRRTALLEFSLGSSPWCSLWNVSYMSMGS